MRAPSSLQLAGIFFIIAIGLLVLIVTHKPAKTVPEAPVRSSVDSDTITKYIDEAEKQNELERDKKEQANKLAKMIKAKKDSVECQFWQQQKQKKATNRVDEKITQFCELSPEQIARYSPQAEEVAQ